MSKEAQQSILSFMRSRGNYAHKIELLDHFATDFSRKEITSAISELRKSGTIYTVPDMRDACLGTYYQCDL